ncbi:hypothetical protein CBS101457_000697 [Exobasidium rhododendri]|nr:hypothetical protein CBS101457_000697 [Exobasidium rhododendri]
MTSRGDQVPLLNQNGEAYEEQPDSRFTIDEENTEDDQTTSQRRPLDSPDSPKYPPSAPPPTYREATGKSLISLLFTKLSSSISLPDLSFIKRFGSNIWTFICRFWPTSRFAQVGFFMLGLWVLVIVSGPAFEDAGPRAGGIYPWGQVEEQMANNGPGPISGDGHIIAPTNWTLRSCHNSHSHHGQVVCTSTTRIELDIPTVFDSTEGLFIYADPPRQDHLSDKRGKVPGTIEFKIVEEGSHHLTQSPKGKVQVLIDARYEQNKIEVFEKTTIVKMASQLYTQGVGIYTHELPARFDHLDTVPLMLFITVLIPSGAAIPEFRTQASAMNIGAFTPPHSVSTLKNKHNTRDALIPPTFGRFSARTITGSIQTGTDMVLDANGLIQFGTSNGNIMIAGRLHSQAVRLESLTGNIVLEEGCQITASRESQLTTQTGSIELKKNSWVLSGEILGKATNGGIKGGLEGGIWRTNKTIELHSSNGAIRAAIEVLRPTDRFYNPTEIVSVAAKSMNGAVDLHYVNQEKGVVLRSNVDTSVGVATAEMGANFEGEWKLEGSKGSVVIPTGQEDPRTYTSLERKEGNTNVKEQGSIWFDSKATHGASQSTVRSSLGIAQLRFA